MRGSGFRSDAVDEARAILPDPWCNRNLLPTRRSFLYLNRCRAGHVIEMKNHNLIVQPHERLHHAPPVTP